MTATTSDDHRQVCDVVMHSYSSLSSIDVDVDGLCRCSLQSLVAVCCCQLLLIGEQGVATSESNQ